MPKTSSYIETLKNVSENQHAFILNESEEYPTSFIDTGSYIVNALISGSIYGGLPDNRITAIAGPEATGKTFFALSIMKTYLDTNEDGYVVYFESESAIAEDETTKEMMVSRGIDVSRVLITPVTTIEEFRTQALRMVDSHLEIPEGERPQLFMVLDSLGNLSTNKEMTDMASGSEKADMTRPRLVKAAFRALALKLGRAKIPMLVTNHVYTPIGQMFPQDEMSGGSGLKYAASTIIFLSKRKEKEGKDVVGAVVHCKTRKSRLTKEHQVVDTLLTFDKGLHPYYGLSQLAIKHDIFKKMGTRLELPDGRKIFEKQINANPEEVYTQELLDQLDAVAQKEFLYGNVSELLDEEVTDE